MKVTLVVAAGVHEGKTIPILGTKFLIGRDPECQLRPASQSVSKQHCAVEVRGDKVFVKDFGSTNGTFVNDTQLTANAEQEVKSGDRLKLGPLDFRIEFSAKPSDSTPLPDDLKSVGSSSQVAALREAVGKPAAPAPAPSPAPGPGPQAPKPQRIPGPKSSDDDHDAAAAMLLGMGDEDEPKVPEGSTVFDMGAVPTAEGGEKKADADKDKKGKVPSREDTSSAASDILRRYMRRPR